METDNDPLLSAHTDNWQSADAAMTSTRELVQQKIDKGWVFEFAWDLQATPQRRCAGQAMHCPFCGKSS